MVKTKKAKCGKTGRGGWFVAVLVMAAAVLLCTDGKCAAGAQGTPKGAGAGGEKHAGEAADLGGALSGCGKLVRIATEQVTPGTQIAVSSRGRYLASYVQTPSGVAVTLRNRETGESKSTQLVPPALPPGIAWRELEAAFSPGGRWLAVRGVGVIWVVDTASGEMKFRIGVTGEKQLFPGKMAWAEGELAVLFWPPESVLAEGAPRGPVSVRIYSAPEGKMVRELFLPVHTADSWTVLRFSPDGKRLAVLEEPRKWPGSSELTGYDAMNGKQLWQEGTGAQDIGWSADSKRLVGLSGQLEWFDGGTGKRIGASPRDLGSSEYQRLRFSEAGKLAAGLVARYSSLHRLFRRSEERTWLLAVWRVDTGEELCEVTLPPEVTLDAWVTGRGELMTLEEQYEVRPPLRLLQSSRIVTYRMADLPAGGSGAKK